MTRRRSTMLGAILGIVLVAISVTTYSLASNTSDLPETRQPASTESPPSLAEAPSEPLAEICGNRALLDGPQDPPAEAVEVSTSDNLDELTRSNPPGTTFWLEPGVHRLGTDEFSQVIPKDNNAYIGAPGAVIDGQEQSRYAFTGDASGVTIRNLTIENFGAEATNSDEGVVNHDAAADWTIARNTIRHNAGAGVMVGSGNRVRGNCLQENGQYGFSAYHPDGITDIVLERNEITGNNTDDWERRRSGCGCTGGGKFWEVTDGVVRKNWVHDNRGVGLWADTNNVGFVFEGNYIEENDAEGIFYEASYNAVIRLNTFVRNGLVKGANSDGFPAPAIYLSEAGSDSRAGDAYSSTFEITENVFTDNWSGVVLWENADRFAGSPANTSTGSGTAVNPDVATAETCNPDNIENEPYIDDCRWKTQNVLVHDNTFQFDQASLGRHCTPAKGCGFNGLFANWGTFPDWSPYHGEVVQDQITFEQNNRFSNNTYKGPWCFMVHGQGNQVTWADWQAEPYGQDTDSVMKVANDS